MSKQWTGHEYDILATFFAAAKPLAGPFPPPGENADYHPIWGRGKALHLECCALFPHRGEWAVWEKFSSACGNATHGALKHAEGWSNAYVDLMQKLVGHGVITPQEAKRRIARPRDINGSFHDVNFTM